MTESFSDPVSSRPSNDATVHDCPAVEILETAKICSDHAGYRLMICSEKTVKLESTQTNLTRSHASK